MRVSKTFFLSILLYFCAVGAEAQVVLAFQGGENTAGDTWNYTNSGGNAEAQAQAQQALNFRSGTRSMAAGGMDPTAGSCFAGGTGNGAVINNIFTFSSIDLTGYPGVPKTLEFWYGNRLPNCNGPGWDNGENLIFTPIINGVAQAPQTLVTGGGDIQVPINQTSFTFDVPPCAQTFGFVLNIALNRRDELLFLDDVKLTADGPPADIVLDAGEGGSICPGGTIELDGTAGNGLTGLSWSGGTGVFANSQSPSTSYTAGTGDTGSVTLQLSATDACNNVLTSTVVLSIDGQLPVPSITSSEGTSICQGEFTVLTAFGGIDYLWSNGEIGEDIIVDMPGTYSVEVSNDCGAAIAEIVLTESDLIEAQLQLALCPGEVALLPDGSEVSGAGVYEVVVSVPTSCDTVYTVTVVQSVALGASVPAIVCDFVAETYTVSVSLTGGNPLSYSASGIQGSFASGTFTTLPIEAGSPYSFFIEDGNGCGQLNFDGLEMCTCEASGELTGGAVICEGQSAALTITFAGQAPYSFAYSDGIETVNGTSPGNQITLSVSPQSSSNYSLVSVSDAVCTGTAIGNAAISVDPLPWAGTGSAVQICDSDGPLVLFNMLGGNPATGGLWTAPDGESASGNLVPAIDGSGSYVYTVSSDNCGEASAAVAVTVVASPSATWAGEFERCPGFSIAIPLEVEGEGSITIEYALNGTQQPTVSLPGPPYFLAAGSSGTYLLQKVSNALCEAPTSGTAVVVDLATPAVAFTWTDNSSDGSVIDLTFTADSSVDAVAYTWEFFAESASGSTRLGSAEGTEARFAPRSYSGGNLRVCLELTSLEGCSSTRCELIQLETTRTFFMPNAFTPNGDGLNDLFKPVIGGYTNASYTLQVFDRLGHIVFETDDPMQGWNGSNGAGEYYLPAGVYAWRVVLQPYQQAAVDTFVGHVTIVR